MNEHLPQLSNYGQYASSNYGAYCLKMQLFNVTVWFSYQTMVAFYSHETGLVVRENDWGPTTGKHLNWIDGGNKAERVSSELFQQKLEDIKP